MDASSPTTPRRPGDPMFVTSDGAAARPLYGAQFRSMRTFRPGRRMARTSTSSRVSTQRDGHLEDPSHRWRFRSGSPSTTPG
jgi:hypothetical protein